MDKKSKNTLIVSIIALALVLIGVTYAYFSAIITGLESASTLSLTAGRMGIVYSEGDENISVSNIYPREEAWLTKTFTLTGWNTTDQPMKYNVGLNVITNTFPDDYLTYDLKVLQSTNGTSVSEKTNSPLNGTGNTTLGRGTFTNADGDVHKYELKIYFKDNGLDQNDGQGAVFNAKINIGEFVTKNISIPITEKVLSSFDIDKTKCEALFADSGYSSDDIAAFCAGEPINNGDITIQLGDGTEDDYFISEGVIINPVYEDVELDAIPVGYEVEDGQYTYIYGKYFNKYYHGIPMYEILNNSNSWSVILTDSLKNNGISTDPVTTQPASSVNGLPVTSMANMFQNSSATRIDLSAFDTSNIVDMSSMFYNCEATSLDLSSFDTSNVTSMKSMFANTAASTLDLSSFNTSKVTDMSSMFSGTAATYINVSNLDTSALADSSKMDSMFRSSQVETINFSNANLVNMPMNRYLFAIESYSNDIHYLALGANNLNNINFSNSVFPHISGDGEWLFGSVIKTLDFTNTDFSLSNTLNGFFRYGVNLHTIIMRNAKTQTITDMSYMFYNYQVTDPVTIDISGINTSNVIRMSHMFNGTTAISIDLSSFNTSNVTDMSSMFADAKFESINVSNFDTSNVTDMSGMFAGTLPLTLDLSSFDMTKVSKTSFMFQNANATTVYARTQEDADKMNASSSKPAGLTAVVGP